MSTEWSMNNPGNNADWAKLITQAWPIIEGKLVLAHYYTYKSADAPHGADGLVDDNLNHISPFWAMYSAFHAE